MLPMMTLPGSGTLAMVFLFFFTVFKSRHDIVGSPATTSSSTSFAEQYGPVLRVSMGWMALYFAFLFFQSFVKFYAFRAIKAEEAAAAGANKKSDDNNKRTLSSASFISVKYGSAGAEYGTLVVDRTVGNMMEQCPPFFLALWMHALCVDQATAAPTAAQLGWAWLASRSIYPFVFNATVLRGAPTLFVSTFGGYSCILALMWPVAGLVL